MPPCAYSDEDSRRLSLATTSTWPASASSMAARSPATPAPITRKSGFILTCDHIRGNFERRSKELQSLLEFDGPYIADGPVLFVANQGIFDGNRRVLRTAGHVHGGAQIVSDRDAIGGADQQ